MNIGCSHPRVRRSTEKVGNNRLKIFNLFFINMYKYLNMLYYVHLKHLIGTIV